MRYEGQIYRPPSEAWSWILQATVGCSWNHCTYCAMYAEKEFRVRPLPDILEDIAAARRELGPGVDKVFVADGDPLAMDLDHWEPILTALADAFPNLRRVSTYATAMNLVEKDPADLARLRELGLSLLYIGPESGDDKVLKRIAKGADFAAHEIGAKKAHEARMKLSAIFLLGAGGTEWTEDHARGSAKLCTAMDPRFVSLLTLTVIPGTPISKLEARGTYTLPDVKGLLQELRWFVEDAAPRDAIFRTNHASNYLPLAGRIPKDREKLLKVLDAALEGDVRLREEWMRGL
jgi:radical SAM superfamily enzyme YgiQ (UPF0313 family)